MLRKTFDRDLVNELWGQARQARPERKKPCPACGQSMATVSPAGAPEGLALDVCTRCHFVWFDPKEYEQLPPLPPPPTPAEADASLPLEARVLLAKHQAELIAERAHTLEGHVPVGGWRMLPAAFGMPVEQEPRELDHQPWLTWALAASVSLVSFLAFFDLETVVKGYALVPAEAGRYGGLTLLTAFFLHGSFFHLAGNLYFLVVFGDDVEDYLGRWPYLVVILTATVVGALLHIAPRPDSSIPVIGASGGISGLIAFYGMQFPKAQLGFWWGYPLFRWIRMRAAVWLMVWILFQSLGALRQIAGVTQVSFLAHLGGALSGFLFWLMWRENRAAAS